MSGPIENYLVCRDSSSICLGLAALSSLDSGLLLGKDDFHVARGAHVWVNTTVSTVGTATLLLSAVNLDVGDEQLVDVEGLELSIRLSVEEKVEDKLCGLLWPASLAVGGASVLSLGGAANTTAEAAEWHSLGLLNDVLQVGLSLPEHHAPECVACLACVLEVHTEVGTLGLSR